MARPKYGVVYNRKTGETTVVEGGGTNKKVFDKDKDKGQGKTADDPSTTDENKEGVRNKVTGTLEGTVVLRDIPYVSEAEHTRNSMRGFPNLRPTRQTWAEQESKKVTDRDAQVNPQLSI